MENPKIVNFAKSINNIDCHRMREVFTENNGYYLIITSSWDGISLADLNDLNNPQIISVTPTSGNIVDFVISLDNKYLYTAEN